MPTIERLGLETVNGQDARVSFAEQLSNKGRAPLSGRKLALREWPLLGG
jgi:hypothetical protein